MSQYLGQHFLKNKSAIRKIIASLELRGGETVIEIGAGEGALTFPLVHECRKIGAKLIAVEKDRSLALKLFSRDSELLIKEGDILEILPALIHNSSFTIQNYKIVGNIPYYITGKLLRAISELENKPEITILMIQKEVAERICAQPPKNNLLASAVKIWAEPKILFPLSPEDFNPPPEVKSAVIKLESRIGNLELGMVKNYYKLIHIIFKQPRKTLLNNLNDGLDLTRAELEQILDGQKISRKSRPQDLSIEKIKELSTLLFRSAEYEQNQI